MESGNASLLDKWRARYGAIAVAVACLFSGISTWGENWILTCILILGTAVCGMIGFFDIRKVRKEKSLNS
ncbi:hypothetical protein [Halobacillus halophilus]|uniref:hypothetical protein n=1 Tax=Halobacillus halophilus TaxID=1570 RepID=UPI001CD41524|nr:hypothetical protein [Halobacillus halophilus]MCA1010583.1 hypothetical protein [Halobacillus halophilus]